MPAVVASEALDSGQDGGGGSPVSQASVFGMFLTIALCLLAQPSGSLIYDRPRSSIGRVAFFFWRLNPLPCAIEGAMTVFLVVEILRPNKAITSQVDGFARRLHAVAHVLMLFRGQAARQREDGEGEQKDERRDANVTSSTPSPQQPLPGQQASQPRSHADVFVDVVTLLGMCTVVIKISVAELPKHIKPATWMYVAGWVAIQCLQVSAHWSPANDGQFPAFSEEEEQQLSAVTAAVLESFNYNAIVQICLIVGSGTLVVFVDSSGVADLPLAARIVAFVLFIVGSGAATAVYAVTIVFPARSMGTAPQTAPATSRWSKVKTWVDWLNYLNYIWLFYYCVANWVAYFFGTGTSRRYLGIDCSNKYWVTGPSLVWPCMALLVVGPAIWVTGRGYRILREANLCIGLVFVLCLFAVMLAQYDQEQTRKPNWLDWLG